MSDLHKLVLEQMGLQGKVDPSDIQLRKYTCYQQVPLEVIDAAPGKTLKDVGVVAYYDDVRLSRGPEHCC